MQYNLIEHKYLKQKLLIIIYIIYIYIYLLVLNENTIVYRLIRKY